MHTKVVLFLLAFFFATEKHCIVIYCACEEVARRLFPKFVSFSLDVGWIDEPEQEKQVAVTLFRA